LQNSLKLIYTIFAQKPGYGLNIDKFHLLICSLFNLEHHPFIKEMFMFFDKNQDGLISFEEFVKGLDIIERGNMDEKVSYCFKMYDIYDIGVLDIISLRQVLIRSFSTHIIAIENALDSIKKGL
jgi:hypothetical protein